METVSRPMLTNTACNPKYCAISPPPAAPSGKDPQASNLLLLLMRASR